MEIKFVSYDGCYPNLCSGTLTLEIDGEYYWFGSYMPKDKNCYDQFWASGGKVWFDDDWEDHLSTGKWKLNKRALPEFLKPYGNELIKIFNENVPYGCCGGCI